MDPKNRDYSQDELDNHSRQMNPEDDVYWQSRGFEEKPGDWEDLLADEEG